VSPNFQNSPARFRRLLDRYRNMFNQTQLYVELKNEEGELRVTPDNLAGAIDYVSIGEGAWSVEVGADDTERVFSSRDATETFSVEIPRASGSAEELEAAPEKEQTLLERLIEVLRKRDAA